MQFGVSGDAYGDPLVLVNAPLASPNPATVLKFGFEFATYK